MTKFKNPARGSSNGGGVRVQRRLKGWGDKGLPFFLFLLSLSLSLSFLSLWPAFTSLRISPLSFCSWPGARICAAIRISFLLFALAPARPLVIGAATRGLNWGARRFGTPEACPEILINSDLRPYRSPLFFVSAFLRWKLLLGTRSRFVDTDFIDRFVDTLFRLWDTFDRFRPPLLFIVTLHLSILGVEAVSTFSNLLRDSRLILVVVKLLHLSV